MFERLRMMVVRWCYRYAERDADFVIRNGERAYLLRWYVLPRNPICNLYLHLILGDDIGRDLHTHPWLFFVSWMLDGAYVEESFSTQRTYIREQTFRAGAVLVRGPFMAHRLEVSRVGLPGAAMTLVLTGPVVKSWGFWTREGFVNHREYLART